MGLAQKIESDYITAYKSKDALSLSVLRLIKTSIKNLEIELRRDITDDEVLNLILKQATQREDSIEQFSKAQRHDLADKEKAELSILESYLPQKLDEVTLKSTIDSLIQELDAKELSDMGKVMQLLGSRFKGQFDGKVAGQMVRESLQKK